MESNFYTNNFNYFIRKRNRNIPMLKTELIKSYLHENQSQIKLYQPIQFIYTQTIGSVNQKMKEILDPYIWTYQDILIPKIINNHNFIYYYLFHIAPIYNWLKQIPSKEASLLKQYINQKNLSTINAMNSNVMNNKKNTTIINKFDLSIFNDSLKKYVAKWEIAKLCASMKINIKTTKLIENTKNNQIICAHLIKTQQSTLNYTFSHITKTIQCHKVYCQQCQKNIEVVSDIIKYPFAPIFKQFYGDSITFKMMNKSQSITYNVCIAFNKDFVYVKCANKIWYQIGNGTSRAISYERIDFKKAQIVVYQNMIAISENRKILKLAQPLKLMDLQEDEITKNEKYYKKSNKIQQDDSQEFLHQKPTKLQKFNNKIQKVTITNNSAIQKPQKVQEEPLEQLKKQAPLIILNKKKVDTKLYNSYKDKIQSLFDKPKKKDQYQFDYDKGKTKKIKKKVQYIKPDFFNLYKDIQVQNSYAKPHQMQDEQQQAYTKNKNSQRKSSQEQFSKRQKKKYHGSTSKSFKSFKKYPKQNFKNKKPKN